MRKSPREATALTPTSKTDLERPNQTRSQGPGPIRERDERASPLFCRLTPRGREPIVEESARPATYDDPRRAIDPRAASLRRGAFSLATLAFALGFQGDMRVRNADEIMSEMASNGFVVMKRPSSGGGALARGFEG